MPEIQINYLLFYIILIAVLFASLLNKGNNENRKSKKKHNYDDVKSFIDNQKKLLKNLKDEVKKEINKKNNIEYLNLIDKIKNNKNDENYDNVNILQYPKMNIQRTNDPNIDPMYIRDNKVLNDKLYPPLGRTERPTADTLMNFINNQPGIFNMYTRGPPDTFRVMGYLTPKDGTQTIDSTLILYGRAKYPNSDIGEFYATSSSKISDIKIPLDNNNCNIKKVTDLPNDVEIKGNMLSGKYNFTELPKPDLSTPYF